jgi:ATP-dependent DNA helicase RecG
MEPAPWRVKTVGRRKPETGPEAAAGLVDLEELQSLVEAGESETVELKKSTAQLPRAGETLCAFLNGDGGRVLIGVSPDGTIAGQDVADKTQQEIARMLDRFDPPAPVESRIVALPGSERAVIVLQAPRTADGLPFTYDGRPYRRVGTTTSRMSKGRYESLLLERMHARRRWENQPAVGVRVDALDHEEILRTREDAIRHRRISAGTSTDVGDILDRLGLRVDGELTQAAQILYGTRYLPDYPQGKLKLGRFRGTKITGDILDNKQEYMHAFAMVREAIAFLDRTLPLAGHFVEGQIEREDRLPVPPDALREVLLNAVMHRDYAQPGSDVAVAVFDDRIEIWSTGKLPAGITAEMLGGPHKSILRNPLIAETFHRIGAVEVWGRGTNRVIEECERWGAEPPSFEELAGALRVTFPAPIGPDAAAPSRGDRVGTKLGPSRDQVQVLAAARDARLITELMELAERKNRTKFRDQVVRPLLEAGYLEMTIPDKPRSSKQRYRTTHAGRRVLEKQGRE